MERLDTDLLFRWFVGLAIDEPVWDATVFSKNRDRLLEGAIAAKFLAAVLAQPRVTKLMSSEHFSVDGTLIEAWASMKSFRPKDGSGDEPPSRIGPQRRSRFQGPRSAPTRHTPRPRTRKPGFTARALGMEAKLAFLGHALMENRSCLIVNACLTPADGHAERTAALAMIEPLADRPTGVTLGADKGYDARVFVNELRAMNVRPHVAQNTNRPQLRHRWAHDAPCRLRDKPAHSQTHRRGVRLDEIHRGPAQDPVSRRRARRMVVHLRRDGLRSRAAAKTPGGLSMSAPRPAGGSPGSILEPTPAVSHDHG